MQNNTEFKAVKNFIVRNYKHFNAAVVIDAAQAWVDHLKKGNKMFFTMAGAMSTAEMGISLAEMIRQGKIHAITCTGANLEEDIFNLVAHTHYKRVPHYRQLSPEEEVDLLDNHMNRVTDTCIPEGEAIRRLEKHVLEFWKKADKEKQRFFPHEFFYTVLRSGVLKQYYEIDPKNSWLLAACEKNLPIFVPGWEDSTLGNIFVAHVRKGDLSNFQIMKSGPEYMNELISWYQENTQKNSVGFFQIGGGIAGDFPICVVPLIQQDLETDCKVWGYFCQISDSTTSYGSYSGAVPNEKITWGKLGVDTPRFIIESDATIVAPLVFAYVLASE
ncbi:deoxyhypusine synthase family protein [Candidatus Woesearchaeota archaeon]|nr:deoxyhypusine synthase family protein [Candidatus Woesearchaeota archaeon]